MNLQDTRRARRHQVPYPVPVTDAMTGGTVGQLGNISETGMLLISQAPLVEDALYQLRFPITQHGRITLIDAGAHLLWLAPANTPGLYWAGLRFLTLSEAHLDTLLHWMDTLD